MKNLGYIAMVAAMLSVAVADPEPPADIATAASGYGGWGAPPVHHAPAHGWGAPAEHVTVYGGKTQSHGPTHVRAYHKHSYITKPSHAVEHIPHHEVKHKTIVHQHHHHEKVLHQHHHHQHVLHQHHLHKVHLHNLHLQKQHLHNHHSHKLHVHQPVYHTHQQQAHKVTEEHQHKQTVGEVHKHNAQHHEKHVHAHPIHHVAKGWSAPPAPAHGYGHH